MLARFLTWISMMTLNAALGLHIADDHATTAGWLAFAAGSLLWVSFMTALLIVGER